MYLKALQVLLSLDGNVQHKSAEITMQQRCKFSNYNVF
jgi:hypothetical protein